MAEVWAVMFHSGRIGGGGLKRQMRRIAKSSEKVAQVFSGGDNEEEAGRGREGRRTLRRAS